MATQASLITRAALASSTRPFLALSRQQRRKARGGAAQGELKTALLSWGWIDETANRGTAAKGNHPA